MKYSQLADGRGRVVTSRESDPRLRLGRGTKMALFQRRHSQDGSWFGGRRRAGWGGRQGGRPCRSACLSGNLQLPKQTGRAVPMVQIWKPRHSQASDFPGAHPGDKAHVSLAPKPAPQWPVFIRLVSLEPLPTWGTGPSRPGGDCWEPGMASAGNVPPGMRTLRLRIYTQVLWFRV